MTEADFQPLWGQERPGIRSFEMQALEAFIDFHVSNPDQNLGIDEWEAVWSGAEIPGMARLEAVVMRKRQQDRRRTWQDPWRLMAEAGLTEKEQRAMELAGIYGPTSVEISRHMDIARATALTKIERGREKIQRRLRGGRNWAESAS